VEIRRADDHPVVPWANGLGTTRVIARVPDDDSWSWRLSLADVVSDGPFSVLPGIDRWIIVASGAGMRLTVGTEPAIPIGPDSAPMRFSGDADTSCELVDGPIVDLNLMLRRSLATGRLDVITCGAGDTVEVSTAAVVLVGSADAGAASLGPLDAVIGSAELVPRTSLARIALVTLEPAALVDVPER
jgi:uncharacterized protein